MGKVGTKKRVFMKQKRLENLSGTPLKSVAAAVGATTIEVEATIASPEILQRQLELEIPPRLAALQRQLEILDQERYLAQKCQEQNASPNHHHHHHHHPVSSNDISLKTLRKRLAEVRLQLYGNSPTSKQAIHVMETDMDEILSYYEGTTTAHDVDENSDDDQEINSVLLDEDFMEDFLIKEVLEGDEDDMDGEDIEDDDDDDENSATPISINAPTTTITTHENTKMTTTTTDAEIDNALSILDSSQLPNEEKMSLIRQKFSQLLKQDALWRGEASKAAQMVNEMRRQRQIVSAELDKANAIRQKLELMCRDLHQENRKLKMEIQAVTTPRLPENIPPITLEQLDESMLPIIPEHVEKEGVKKIVERLCNFSELFTNREKHVQAVLGARNIETQILHARLAKSNLTIASQTGKIESDQRRIIQHQRTETTLRQQLKEYVDKFRQVEETLAKSNDLFTTFRQEMEQMTSKLAKLERENNQLQSKCSTLSKNIIEMADERAKIQQALETMKNQKGKLEVLCRALQAERKQQQAKESNYIDN